MDYKNCRSIQILLKKVCPKVGGSSSEFQYNFIYSMSLIPCHHHSLNGKLTFVKVFGPIDFLTPNLFNMSLVP